LKMESSPSWFSVNNSFRIEKQRRIAGRRPALFLFLRKFRAVRFPILN
jgi:hypothetical protein